MKIKIKNVTPWEIQTISQTLINKAMRFDNKNGSQEDKLKLALMANIIDEIIEILKTKYAQLIINQSKKVNLKLSVSQSLIIFHYFSGNIEYSQVVNQIEHQIFISNPNPISHV